MNYKNKQCDPGNLSWENQEKAVTECEFLNVDEAAMFLKLSKSSLYKMTHDRKIRYSKPSGKIIYFRKSDLLEYLNKNVLLSKEDLEKRVNGSFYIY